MSKKPYLSIVVATRNDDHDGSLAHRMRLFFHVLTSQMVKYNMPLEIVIVEWNPPKKRLPLKDVLNLPKKNNLYEIRIITVPNRIHELFRDSDKLNLFQFISKNVGIRRSRGKFILATNIDILFSDQLLDILSKQNLGENEMLRAIRYDVPDKIREVWSEKKIIAWCKKNKLKGYFPVGAMPKKNNLQMFLDRIGVHRTRPSLFTNACGDFTLLSREFWYKVQGYPELPVHGVKIDGLLCYNAYFAGAKERILSRNKCVYHIDHANSWSGEKGDDLQSRLNKLEIPFITREEYIRYIGLMVRKNKPFRFNDEHWGLAKYSFQEYVQ